MINITELAELEQLIEQQPGLVVLFGGEHCNVCQVIKPKLEELITQRYPNLAACYIDCKKTSDICAQNSIFTLPVVKVYLNGQCFIEKARSFSLPGLMDEIQRPYSMLFD